MAENILLSSILDRFIAVVEADESLDKNLVESIKKLRTEGKLAKGVNLKTLIDDFASKDEDENSAT